MTTADELLALAHSGRVTLDAALLQRAFVFASKAHAGQRRLSGDPYIVHPIATAKTLIQLRLDEPTIIAGLLHDVPEDTGRTVADVAATFGGEVASLVDGVTKLSVVRYRGVERYEENLRRMFLAMAQDIRVIFVKFADRLHNLQTLDALPLEKQRRIATETLQIYAPIANRLGMGDLRGRLEDAAFKFAHPDEYRRLVARIEEPLSERTTHLERIRTLIEDELAKHRVNVSFIDGRVKHLYSLWKKLQNHDDDIGAVYDLIAIRIVVNTVDDCYASLGLLHQLFTPLKGRIKDYIAQPKPNGYRSLHTTVFCKEGRIVEIQIRTHEMHAFAEHGIAAHWQYDEQHKRSVSVEPHYAWVNELLERQREAETDEQYLESLKLDVFQNQIFVFTPDGDVIQLPEAATPVDFAYAIHTDIGNHCAAAKVNERIATLDAALKSGDICEILKEKNRKGPNADWLSFVKTAAARSKIRQSLHVASPQRRKK